MTKDNTTDSNQMTSPVDERLPAPNTLALSLQHLLAAYASLIVTPLVVASALGWSNEDLTYLIGAALVTSGICTIIQCVGFGDGFIGIRLPVVQGTTIAAIPALILIGGSSNIQAMFGATIVAGVVALLLATHWSRMLRYFPPVVVGTVITAIGVSLLPVAVMWMGGGAGMGAQTVTTTDMALAFFTLAVVLLVMRFGQGLLARSAILIGLLLGSALAFVMGEMNLDAMDNAAWFGAVVPLAFGMPIFEWPAIATMVLVMLVTMVESTGDYLAIGEVCNRPVTQKDIAAGLRAEGLGTVIGGIMNSFPFTTFSQNTGVLRISGVRSRWVVAVTGGLMIVLGLLPKIAAIVSTIPTPVLGGCGLVMFGSIAVTGINMLRKVDLDDNGNLLTICVSLGMAMIVIANPTFFAGLPNAANMILANSITLAGVCAVALNIFFSGRNN